MYKHFRGRRPRPCIFCLLQNLGRYAYIIPERFLSVLEILNFSQLFIKVSGAEVLFKADLLNYKAPGNCPCCAALILVTPPNVLTVHFSHLVISGTSARSLHNHTLSVGLNFFITLPDLADYVLILSQSHKMLVARQTRA